MSRVRIRSSGERMNPVIKCEATGRIRGGWWNGDKEGKKRACRKPSMRGCRVDDSRSLTVSVSNPVAP